MTPPLPFDVCGELPAGVTVLEASAGTGKTFTIAALTARYVAEGIPLDRILLVTFGRMATGELRSRVRERLVSAEAGLVAAPHGVPVDPPDDVVTLLSACAPDELDRRRDRLRHAVSHFDAATIATTHGFCQHVLSALGVLGDLDRHADVVEDTRQVVDEIVADLYLRKFASTADQPQFTVADARAMARTVTSQPATTLAPEAAAPGSDAALRRRFADAVRREFGLRKRRGGLLTYDDLLGRLADTLNDAVRGPLAVARLRERFDVVMVDEFQDTDAVQWDILRTAFAATERTLVLIGDPKQAIYAFRGADVHSYLDAASAAATTHTLARNWRSDGDLVDALDALYGDATLGHPDIRYRSVTATEGHAGSRLRGAPEGAALRVRILERGDGRVGLTDKGFAQNDSARRVVAADLADDIARLLTSGARISERRGEGTAIAERVVTPGDVAVLVSIHRHGALIRDALEAVGVPSVLSGAGSVFGTDMAKDWLTLLHALERPSSVTRVHAAALTVFLGWTATEVATADTARWEDVYVRLQDWGATLRTLGVAAMFETITQREDLPQRVLGREAGERAMTDLRHVGQLLHHHASRVGLGPSALTAWLHEQVAEHGDELHDEERSRRLDTDSDAVQILTIHRCKGLEFPVVYCPFLWYPTWIPDERMPTYHDPGADGRRTIDVGGPHSPGHEQHRRLDEHEVRGEAMRAAYVAMTRAKHQLVIHWASTYDSRQSPLALLLAAPTLAPGTVELRQPLTEAEVRNRMRTVAAAPGRNISTETMGASTGRRWAPAASVPVELSARRFDRQLDTTWRRASYSGLTADTHGATVDSEAEVEGTVDEVATSEPTIITADAAADDEMVNTALPLGEMPGGTRVGTLVHSVLEHTDFAAPDLAVELRRSIGATTGWGNAVVGSGETLVEGLSRALETPLGPDDDDVRLRDVSRVDRLDELDFELPLAGGDTPTGLVPIRLLADLFARHIAPTDTLGGYADRLRDPNFDHVVRGYLAGSIDAVLRVHGSDGDPRFLVVDYKTNRLGLTDTPLSIWDYRPVALTTAMQHAHYPLQAIFYAVALHRYLRWRMPSYDPDRHLGGVRYLFLRGMIGADTPVVEGGRCGVFAWHPPSALVVDVSDLFDRGAP